MGFARRCFVLHPRHARVDEIASMGVDVGTGIPTRGAACAWDDEIAPFVGARERIPSRTSSSRFAARAGDNW